VQLKLDQFEQFNEAGDLYLGENSDSVTALKVKSCDSFRLFGQEIASPNCNPSSNQRTRRTRTFTT
jgi:hypothetical protein